VGATAIAVRTSAIADASEREFTVLVMLGPVEAGLKMAAAAVGQRLHNGSTSVVG
jgi:hypothetical protein